MESRNYLSQVKTPLLVSFTRGTTRSLNYSNSSEFNTFLAAAVKTVKSQDKISKISGVELHKRGRKPQQMLSNEELNAPQSGSEFFFSNVLVKIYQVPMLFSRSSEESENSDEGAFMVLIFEK